MASPQVLPVACRMSGGPQDGVWHEFDILPVMLLLREHPGGFYKRTEKRTEDGAHVFEYHGPQSAGSRAF